MSDKQFKDFESNKDKLIRLIKEYKIDNPKSRLRIDTNSETMLKYWYELNNIGFGFEMETGPFKELFDTLNDDIKQLESFSKQLKSNKLLKVNFHFEGDKNNSGVIFRSEVLLKIIAATLKDNLPKTTISVKTKKQGLAEFIRQAYKPITKLKEFGFTDSFFAYFLELENKETFKRQLNRASKG